MGRNKRFTLVALPDVSAAARFPFAAALQIIAPSSWSSRLNSQVPRLAGVESPPSAARGRLLPSSRRRKKGEEKKKEKKSEQIKTQLHFNMYSNKNEGPRRGRSFDSMNIGFEEKLLNNEVRVFFVVFFHFVSNILKQIQFQIVSQCSMLSFVPRESMIQTQRINLSRFVVLKFTSKN